jgi:hypothetical protein
MNRNQKIALGCGGAGCLGLIVIVIVCVVLFSAGYLTFPGSTNRNYNSNSNTNRKSNDNSNAGENSNSNSSSSSSTMSDDDKHKLFQAAGITQDSDLIQKVLVKIGFSVTGGPGYEDFVKDHIPWARRNVSFIQSVLTPEKARAYVNAHLND